MTEIHILKDDQAGVVRLRGFSSLDAAKRYAQAHFDYFIKELKYELLFINPDNLARELNMMFVSPGTKIRYVDWEIRLRMEYSMSYEKISLNTDFTPTDCVIQTNENPYPLDKFN